MSLATLNSRLDKLLNSIKETAPDTIVPLPYRFNRRPYQDAYAEALTRVKRGIKIWHRRAGKDKDDFNAMIEASQKDIGQYYYIFPTYSQAKKAIWEGRDREGVAFLDHIPPSLIESLNHSELKIVFRNGSLIRLVGSDNIDALMGTSPRGVVFSEYSLQNPKAWEYLRPILLENGGWARFNFTPRGKNHAYDLYLSAKDNPNWHVSLLTVDDTNTLDPAELAIERQEMSEDIFQQEYYCSFSKGQDGSWYGKQLSFLEGDGRLTNVPYDPYAPVDTFWDLGVGDSTAIIFAQRVGQEIHLIDHYECNGEGLDHYARILKDRGYNYGSHFAPHDIRVRELGSGARTRLEIARDMGIRFSIVDDLSIYEGIELARSLFSRLWIDETKCKYLFKCLLNYCKKYNEAYNVYSDHPLHNWASHTADAFRMLGVTYSRRSHGRKSLQEIEWEEAKYRKKI